ncbi:hypothetical protein NDU88_000806 [Pleurodeles waltl]|uniref:Uncharacterized protein n=1 Tax=Pleurodeles waltl TaxID=8319 RepID=A0AAV7RB72_PLEWA|nr:hypothetical protein NDU88_000806 [Pleurodeles waltl]
MGNRTAQGNGRRRAEELYWQELKGRADSSLPSCKLAFRYKSESDPVARRTCTWEGEPETGLNLPVALLVSGGFPPPQRSRWARSAWPRLPVLPFARSTDRAPAQVVADYLHDKERKGFEKEVRNRLGTECPRLNIPNNVAETPEINSSVLIFFKKFAKDPKKGINRAW